MRAQNARSGILGVKISKGVCENVKIFRGAYAPRPHASNIFRAK